MIPHIIKSLFHLLLIVLSLFSGCSKKVEEKPAGVVPVMVSIAPLKFFVEKIGGDHVAVSVMVEPGASPHIYEPKPLQMASLSKSKLYFAIGIEFEKIWLPRLLSSAKKLTVVPLDNGIEKTGSPCTHKHHNHEGPCHSGSDPHIWLSPELVKRIAENIAAGLRAADPVQEKMYTENLKSFLNEIKALQIKIKEILAQAATRQFMVFHPSWGYFAHEYNLKQIPIEVEGKEPGPQELVHLIDAARRDSIKTIFTQPQFSQKSAETIASQINGNVVTIDPLAYEWDDNLLTVAKALAGK